LVNKVKQILEQLIERASQFTMVLAGALVVLMAFITTYGVVRRYIFNSPEPYSYEFSVIFLLLSFVLAVAALERLNRFIRVDILASRFSKGTNNVILNIVTPILGLAFCVILTWKGGADALYALQMGQLSRSAWQVPLFPIKIIIPIGYGLLCLVLITRLCRGLASLEDSTKKLTK
jgi:TRAP-type mannitol/chloroaromatic compound transport system permease small subunit